MRVFVIDTKDMDPELQRGLIGVTGSTTPDAAEKQQCVDVVSRYAVDGWAIAADLRTPLGQIAARTAETACVPFVQLNRVAEAASHVPPSPSGPAVERLR